MRAIIGVILAGFFWCLILYWGLFIGYTAEKLVAHGPRAVLGWYAHISNPGLSAAQWSAKGFIIRQATLAAVTVLVWSLSRRVRRLSTGVSR